MFERAAPSRVKKDCNKSLNFIDVDAICHWFFSRAITSFSDASPSFPRETSILASLLLRSLLLVLVPHDNGDDAVAIGAE
mmetsp:Transcript_20040/g.55315  ORF Transcript_20040/g.55315 Transcript_20040/m.55315 type:complete len:80 (+) Transcript_20040:2014-2253(+)